MSHMIPTISPENYAATHTTAKQPRHRSHEETIDMHVPGGYAPRHNLGEHRGDTSPSDLPDRTRFFGLCPGKHCAGRVRAHEHRGGVIPWHKVSPTEVGQ